MNLMIVQQRQVLAPSCLTTGHHVALPLPTPKPRIHALTRTQAIKHRSRHVVCSASISATDALGVGLFFAPSIAILAYSYIRGKGTCDVTLLTVGFVGFGAS